MNGASESQLALSEDIFRSSAEVLMAVGLIIEDANAGNLKSMLLG